ncbi:GntR family transcriptional regulator [Microbacterium sp. No. 7]|uniref:GntR family transcriptional regulator n=1 Tax=Microbacterium sp. No. 7 TaxID=1714373 RepID=UPI0006D05C83|nr:GntR family transcriptional regulator [Microbacterium sp. No. 7]ALJ20142.1 hypothetical protein AOA12_09550 [Microbacterium sp. No. 7]
MVEAGAGGGAETPDESLAQQAYQKLRTAIITGHYPQGTAIKEGRLASELNVSRVPVRTAIHQLDNDGFLRTAHRRSARVAEWTARTIEEFFDVRLGLETLAARLAARRAAEAGSVQPLRAVLERAHDAVAQGDRLAVAEAHAHVHDEIVRMAGSELLTALMRPVIGRMTWLFYLTADRDPHTQSHEHDDLLHAIETGNERLAESLAYAHIEKGRVPTLVLLGGGEQA